MYEKNSNNNKHYIYCFHIYSGISIFLYFEKTIELKKYPRRHKDTDPMHQRIPTAMICCYVDSENGIEQLDTSDIETYEIWDIEDTTPVVVYEDQYSFADYILSNPPSYLIKLYSTDYIYIGRVE